MMELITDRTEADVTRLKSLTAKGWDQLTDLERLEWLHGSATLALRWSDGEPLTCTDGVLSVFQDGIFNKGAYNYTDLNRVTAAMEYLDETLRKYGYVTGYQRLEIPHGYTQVEYIESSGTQYIDTGFIPNQDTGIVMDFQATFSNANNMLVGQRSSTTSNNLSFLINQSGNFRFGYNDTVYDVGSADTDRHTVSIQKNECYLDEELAVTATYTSYTGYGNLWILYLNTSSGGFGGSARLYSCQIYDNDELIRNYVPCINNADGAAGLYDLVNGVFYANAGSGSFTAGEPIELPDEYTWMETDVPTESQMAQYLSNVLVIYRTILTEPELPEKMEELDYDGANQIEQALLTLNTAIEHIVAGFARSDCFTFWSGNRPFPCAKSDLGRTWEELDAMNTTWRNWQVASWYLLLYGNLEAEGDVT